MRKVYSLDKYKSKKRNKEKKEIRKSQHILHSGYSTKRIESIIDSLLNKHQIIDLPIDLYGLAKKENITIMDSFFANQNTSSVVRRFSDKKFIYVMKNYHQKDKNFLVAHALGHLYLHMFQNSSISDDDKILNFNMKHLKGNQNIIKEVEANKFAYTLLLPKDKFLLEYKRTQSIFELSEIFQVPEKAILFQIKNLNLDSQFNLLKIP